MTANVTRSTESDLEEYATTRDPRLRDGILLAYEGLARRIAAKYSRHPDDFDDLLQVARFALVKALERFDPARGIRFSTFGWATATGEVRRYLRETSWTVRVPRSLQEAYLDVARARDEMSGELGRPATVEEVAAAVGRSVDEVIEAIDAGAALRPASLNATVDNRGEDTETVIDLLGSDDRELDAVDDREVARTLIRQLSDRERVILRLRFDEEMTQTAIAEKVGISQMQVSRLLSSILHRLRAEARAAN